MLEAKGRTGSHSKDAMISAKKQTRHLRKINGDFPSLRVAVQCSFSPRMQWAIQDPDEYEENARDVEFDIESVMGQYYSPVRPHDSDGISALVGERSYVFHNLIGADVKVGLDMEIVDRLTKRTMHSWRSESGRQTIEKDGERYTIFSDGLAISLGKKWNMKNMCSEPLLR